MDKTTNPTPKVGESIYVSRFFGQSTLFSLVEVVKVTPSGAIDVKFHANQEAPFTRFRPDGREQGETRRPYEIDTIPTADRKALLDQEQRTKDAATAISTIMPSDVNYRYGKEGLSQEIARLEALLADAKAKVEAI